MSVIYSYDLFAAEIDATVKISVCGNGVKEGGEQCDGADIGGLSCSALGWDGGALSCTSACDFNVASCSSNHTDAMLRNTFLVSGGDVTLTDKGFEMQVSLPNGAHQWPLTFNIFVSTSTGLLSFTPPPDQYFVNGIYEIIPYDSNGSIVNTLLKPVTFTVFYTENDILGLNESSLQMYHKEEESGDWVLHSDYVHDEENNTVQFSSNEFSFFTFTGSSADISDSITNVNGGGSYVRKNGWITGNYSTVPAYSFENFMDQRLDTESIHFVTPLKKPTLSESEVNGKNLKQDSLVKVSDQENKLIQTVLTENVNKTSGEQGYTSIFLAFIFLMLVLFMLVRVK